LAAALVLAGVQGVAGDERFITVASTTSTENSGLFRHILPLFEARTGIAVRVVAVGTGQAIRLARNGDADVLLVHHRPSEIAFVAAGHGVSRRDVMYNDFVLVGPRADPAGLRGITDAAAAFARLAATRALFASRGDDSGTHKAELSLWRAAGVDVAAASGTWYREMGAGMGATLNSAAAMDAYALADRATWLAFRNKAGLEILVEGDPRMFNQYGVILVNPARHGHVKRADGQAFIDWLTAAEGQRAIAEFSLDGEQLFVPNAGPR
jgi:tungstate transport system substrate-binding protein